MAEVVLRSEPLYLDKEGANDIFINNCQLLKQHQIDGLRFLYTHFKKKKSGIIINYPERCGKSVTVVLFLYAIQDLIKKPILILCREDEMICWKNYFLKWTEYTEDDIIIDPPKLVKGKKIFITNARGTPFYRSQSWSIAVVKEDNISKDLSWILDADYRIWLTSTDMKKDLKMLAFIYQWIYPKIKLDIKDFIPTKNNIREMYAKSIYLDYFLEDFAIRVDNVKAFNSTKNTNHNAVTNQTPKKSRKNKDPTGTKVKRSRISDNDITLTNKSIITNIHNVETFPITNTIKKENITNSECNSTDNVESLKQDDVLIRNVSNDDDGMDTFCSEAMTFQNAVNDIVSNENIFEKSTESIDFDNFYNKESCKENKIDISEGNLDSCPNVDNFVANDIVKNVNLSEHSTESIEFDINVDFAKTEMNKSSIIDNFSDFIQKNDVVDSMTVNDNGNENLHDNLTQSIDFDNINTLDSIDDSKVDIKQNVDDSNTLQINTDVTEQKTIENVEKPDNSINESLESIKEEKLSDLEESMLKKFKGSFLDRLF